VLRNDSREVELEKRVRHDEAVLRKFFGRLVNEGAVAAGYEAGCMGFELCRQLRELGVSCVVIAPGKVPRKPSERVKTDRRDARVLAGLLKYGEVETVRVPSEADEAIRDYLRAREDIRRELTHYRQRLGHLLLRHGYVYRGKNWTLGHRRWLKGLEYAEPMVAETVELYYHRILELEAKLEEMAGRIQELGEGERYRERVARLRCLRGVDWLTALSVVVEIGDFRRFSRAEQFMGFLGLVPSEHSSGEKRRQGGITKAGNSHVRRLLVEAAWHYRSYHAPSKKLIQRRAGQPERITSYADRASRRLSRKYQRLLYRGKPSQVAVTAVTRELAGFMWGLMVDRTEPADVAA
jgi:transposase